MGCVALLIRIFLLSFITVAVLPMHAYAATTRHYKFHIKLKNVTRLCHTKSIVTVNDQFPGPRIVAREGDRLLINVVNHIQNNISIHWHGIRQIRSGWADGPAYVTQCPIQTGQSYVYNFTVVGQRGTLFWHAHISWLRATVYGALVILPKRGIPYPFTKPYKEVPIIFGEWWNADPEAVINQALQTGGGPNVSDAYTINGLPGPLYNCSAEDTFKILWWCILSTALPVRGVIGRRFYIADTKCPFCEQEEESIEHLFLTCDVALHFWRSSPWGIFPVRGNGIRVWDWVKFLWSLKNRGISEEEVFLYASIVIDTIWRARNEKVHNNLSPDVPKCIDLIYTSFADLHASLVPSPTPTLPENWNPPPEDWIKLNCDVRVGLASMCTAVVARNHLGEVIRIHTTQLDFSDALCGEAAACCSAISLAIDLGLKYIIIESDSRLVINVLNGKESHWALENYVSFCLRSTSSFTSCNFFFVSRQCNFAAHNVAKWAFTHQMYGCIPVSTLPENLLCNDREV